MSSSSHGRPSQAPSGPFICTNSNCGKSFLRKEHLNRHLVTHTNFRPYKCVICGRTFARRDILNRHMLQHNVPTGGEKRTVSACQACQRRKSKCDSNQPCSMCAERGEACEREQPSAHGLRQSRRRNLFREEDEDTPTASVNGEQSQDQSSLQPQLDPCVSVVPGVLLPTFTPSRTPLFDLGESNPLFGFAENSFTSQSSGSEYQIPVGQPLEVQTGESASFPNSGAFAAPAPWPQLQDEFVTAQIGSDDFHHFHQAWPFLHVPTFTLEEHTLLTSAMANLFMWIRNAANRNHLLPDIINQELIEAFVQKGTEESNLKANRPLQNLQALVVTLIWAILGNAPTLNLNWASQWTDIAISAFRQLGVLNAMWLPENHEQSTEERWALIEQMKRLVYTVLRIDAYLSIMLDRPPILRYQEMRIPLPVSENVWRAKTKEIRTKLRWNEPAGRARSVFSSMMRDGLDTNGYTTGYLQMPCLSLEDNHFSLCAFLSELWAVSKEANEGHHLHYQFLDKGSYTTDRLELWKAHLRDWYIHIEKSDELEVSFFSSSQIPPSTAAGQGGGIGRGEYGRNNPFLGLNLTLYHLVSLKVYANLRLLEYRKCCGYCQDANVEKVISDWADSADGRHAVYHAVQLKRVYEREDMIYRNPHDHRLSNPLGTMGLFASAIVLCLYSAKVTSSLGATMGLEVDGVVTPLEAVELTQSKFMDTPENKVWISQGGLAAVDGVPLNAFSVPGFSSWYHKQLASSPVYASRLVTFLLTLKL
ncbi:hypothetical protein BJX66DRAFT_309704 [Aspergillus keveii]|uniref:C2H2 type zinc finger domain protein n=1 Tax=Aspergillus keveii TaxID=714993 RepID=A0ABR4FXD9_9EURO